MLGRRSTAGPSGKQYVPYNNQPRDVGSRTGATMPSGVPRNSMGFEDPDEFFKSPEASREMMASIRRSMGPGGGDGDMSMTTGYTRTPGTGRTSRSMRTPGGATSTPGTVRKRSRMSDLAEGDDLQMEEGLLVDDDFADIDNAPYFNDTAAPSVSLPRKSRLPPASPSVGYDNIPSPALTSPGQRRQPKSASKRRTDPDEMEEEVDIDQTLNTEVTDMDASPRARNRQRQSMMSRRSGVSTGDMTIDDAGFDGGFGADDAPFMDDGGDDHEPLGDLPDEDDVGMEQDAVNAEEEEEEEEPLEDRPAETQKKGRSPKKNTAKVVRAGSRPAHQPSQKPYTRVSRLPHELDPNQFEGDFIRRSGRRHFAPLAFWRNEKFEYVKGEIQPQVAGVYRNPEDPVIPFAAKNKGIGRARSRSRAKSTTRHSSVMSDGDENDVDDRTNPSGLVAVYNAIEGQEDEEVRKIALPRSRIAVKPVKGSDFYYQKVFGEDQFLAGGFVHLPKGKEKPAKPSRDNAYVFYVIQGAVNVKIHKTSMVLGKGGSFLIPRGNTYSIANISDVEARLFFAQSRKLRAGEKGDEEDGPLRDVSVAAERVANQDSESDSLSRKKAKSMIRASLERVPEEDEGTPRAVQKVKTVRRKL